MRTRTLICVALAFTVAAPNALGADQWVATWAAAPQSAHIVFPVPARAATPANPPPLFPPPPNFTNQTVRMIARSSIGGRGARIHLSNAYGSGPLRIGAAHIALHDKDSSILVASDHALMFSGKPSFTIPAGAEIVSDPVALDVPSLADLVVSVYIPGEDSSPTDHFTGLHTTYIAKGDLTAAAAFTGATKRESWYWLSGIDVLAPTKTALIVAFGDSITDGATSTPDMDQSWPSQLARRLAANKATAHFAIVNEGISGNRLLADGMGVSALTRFDHDVLSEPGVKWLIVLEGINDIGFASMAGPDISLTADDLIAAHKQIIERAHLHGIRVAGATLTPYSGAAYYSDAGETIREAVNQWIRSSKAFDAVIDFDAATQDPDHPKQIRPAYNLRDHLHPNDAGYKAMADAVDLSIFMAR
jgi:lysophospholipase L1-like esterase